MCIGVTPGCGVSDFDACTGVSVRRAHECIITQLLTSLHVSTMKLREVESILSTLETFAAPKWELEQYPTSGHLAGQLFRLASDQYDDVSDKYICDLGCGTGVLTLCASLFGAGQVLGIDIDGDALKVASRNCRSLEEVDNVEFLQEDVCNPNAWLDARAAKSFDTVVMNPPFGTKFNKGIDIRFLAVACNLARNSVYSLHKSSTREFVKRRTEKWGASAKLLGEMRFDIGRMYKFHKKEYVDVDVDMWRFDVSNIDYIAEESFVGRAVGIPDCAATPRSNRLSRRGGRGVKLTKGQHHRRPSKKV